MKKFAKKKAFDTVLGDDVSIQALPPLLEGTSMADTLSAQYHLAVDAKGGNDLVSYSYRLDRTDTAVRHINGGSGWDTIVFKGDLHTLFEYTTVDVASRKIFHNSGSGNALAVTFEQAEKIIARSHQVRMEGSSANDQLVAVADYNSFISGYGGNDFLKGSDTAMDNIYGGADHDDLYGLDGGDYLYGEAGNDYIDGGKNHDQLTGGSGADTFAFDDNWGIDTILDFQNGTDHLNVSKLGYTSILPLLSMNRIQQVGSDTHIYLDDVGTVTTVVLKNFQSQNLDASDFFFA